MASFGEKRVREDRINEVRKEIAKLRSENEQRVSELKEKIPKDLTHTERDAKLAKLNESLKIQAEILKKQIDTSAIEARKSVQIAQQRILEMDRRDASDAVHWNELHGGVPQGIATGTDEVISTSQEMVRPFSNLFLPIDLFETGEVEDEYVVYDGNNFDNDEVFYSETDGDFRNDDVDCDQYFDSNSTVRVGEGSSSTFSSTSSSQYEMSSSSTFGVDQPSSSKPQTTSPPQDASQPLSYTSAPKRVFTISGGRGLGLILRASKGYEVPGFVVRGFRLALIPAHPWDLPNAGKFEETNSCRDAGMRKGDIIVEINGQPLKDHQELLEKLRSLDRKEDVKITVMRFESNLVDIYVPNFLELGIILRKTDPRMVNGKAIHRLYVRGFRVVVEGEDNPCKAAGLRCGDFIEKVDGETPSSPRHLLRLLSLARGSVTITVERGGYS